MKVYLVFVALLSVAVAEVAKFSKCEEYSDDICEVMEVRITPCKNGKPPCKLKKGEESRIQFQFTPQFAADKLKTGLWWASDSGDVPFDAFSDVDACLYTGCPTQPGQKQELSYGLQLSKLLPNGIFTFKWKLWNTDDVSKGCCFKTEVQLRK
ncbi:MD-2-related lipid-recognition protein-like [Maniola hyperantus]|uniref:MD-2-related lipid-recognition protein-like n=1 Tax=Aphantopus hyperantus TaxID=2795564 RepID=UPI00156A6B7A|nr:MD-2-related lipid-recognition protein-like [Maniola hyperantus]